MPPMDISSVEEYRPGDIGRVLVTEPKWGCLGASSMERSVCLIRPPYFTPWSPPLGIALLKSFLQQRGHSVFCVDFNADSQMWSLHKKYFDVLQSLGGDGEIEGHSKLWRFLYAHLLAFVNGADRNAISRGLLRISPLYDLRCDHRVIDLLCDITEKIFRRLRELLNRHDFTRYWAVGTSTYSTSLAPSLFVLRHVSEVSPNTKRIIGGGVFADDLALGSDNLNTLMTDFQFVDHVVIGEGELLLAGVVEETLTDRLITLANLGKTSLSVQDVPSPDFDDFDLDAYFHLTVEGGRSCPFQCSFCSETIQWGTYRKKTANGLTDQVVSLASKYENNHFFMADSLMNPYIENFSKELLARDASISYDGYLRADAFVGANSDRVNRWARSGCVRVRLGVETASETLLDIMDKKTTPAHISKAIKTLAAEGIRTTTYWIAGHPGETDVDVRNTLEFIKEHRDLIYELEVHPFYYAPYGQVASRLYQSYSVYPDELTELTRFREWDIVNCSPTREERYRRVRQVSELAQSLDIPNIYNMAQRYKAEDRWLRLHPNSVPVY